METLGLVLTVIVVYLAIWTYFDACRQRDSLSIGVGPRNLAPEAWSALAFFFSLVALPVYLKAREEAQLQANPRSGAPPVFESRGLNVFGWGGLLLFLGLAGYLAWEREFVFAVFAVLFALVAAFGGRTILGTDRTLKVELPKAAAFEQVGFRPLPREEDQDEEVEEDLIVNLDRLPPAPTRPAFSATPVAAPPPAPAPPAVPAAALTIPSVSSYPPAWPEPAPAASPAAPSVLRISDITWAASEDDFDDGSSGPPPPPGSRPRGAVASADPALFQQLGGIFAPPGSRPPPGLPLAPAAAPPRPPAPPVAPPALAPPGTPAVARPAAAPPLAPPAPASQPAPRPNVAAASTVPPRGAPPIAGAYAASRSSTSPLPFLLIGGLVLACLFASFFWWRSRPVAEEEPGPAEAKEATVPFEENTPDSSQSSTTPDNSTNAGAQTQEGGPTLDQVSAWMSLYIELLGPAGQNLDIVDFEGFTPDRCALLQQSLDQTSLLGLCPDDQIEFKLRSCLVALPYLAESCHGQDVESWCRQLKQVRTCLHETQIEIEQRWSLPGLIEFTVNEDEPRPSSSISGRCEAEAVEKRSREVDAARGQP